MFGTCDMTLTGRCCGIEGALGETGVDVSSKVMRVESIGVNLSSLSGRSCGIVGIVGDAGSDLSSKVMETESSCVSPGSRCGGVEWGEAGMVIETSSGGVGRVRTILPSDDKGRSCLELEISMAESKRRSAGGDREGSMGGQVGRLLGTSM